MKVSPFKFIYIYIYILYKVEILFKPNLSVYVCETPSWRLESRPLSLTPHKQIYTCGVTITPKVCGDSLENLLQETCQGRGTTHENAMRTKSWVSSSY